MSNIKRCEQAEWRIERLHGCTL